MKLSSAKRTILIVIAGLLLILSLNFFQKEVKGFFYSISFSFQKKLWREGSGSSNFLRAIFEAPNLKKENENLKLQIRELLSEQNYLEETQEENKTLREAMGLGLQDEFQLELVEIIGKDINQDSILIDKGSEDGVSRGLFVITSQKVLIGTVAEAYQNYSRVLLISEKESSFEAKVSPSDAAGIVKGLGGFRVFIDLIPKNKQIKEGDLIVSKGFLVGSIKEIKKTDASPFQGAEISPFFDISNLDKAFVVLDF